MAGEINSYTKPKAAQEPGGDSASLAENQITCFSEHIASTCSYMTLSDTAVAV